MSILPPQHDEGSDILEPPVQNKPRGWCGACGCGAPSSADGWGVYTPVSTSIPQNYMTYPKMGPGRCMHCIVPIALGILVLGTWLQSGVLILVSGGLCFLSAALCLPFSTIAVILFVCTYIWIGFGSKAYYIITHVTATNSSSALKSIIDPVLQAQHPQ